MIDPFEYFSTTAQPLFREIHYDTRLFYDCIESADDVLEIVEKMIHMYDIEDPVIENWNEYFCRLISMRGFVFRDVFRYFSRVPELDFRDVTVGELCDAARQKRWPVEVSRKLLQGLSPVIRN